VEGGTFPALIWRDFQTTANTILDARVAADRKRRGLPPATGASGASGPTGAPAAPPAANTGPQDGDVTPEGGGAGDATARDDGGAPVKPKRETAPNLVVPQTPDPGPEPAPDPEPAPAPAPAPSAPAAPPAGAGGAAAAPPPP